MPRYSFTRKDVLSRAEVEDMIERAQWAWLRALIALLYIFGCRITEATRLCRKDLWLEEGRLVARIPVLKAKKQMGAFRERTHLLRVSLNTPFVDVLLSYLNTIEDPESFIWSIGGTWGAARTKAWQEIKRLNPKCSPHVFRHTRLTKLALKGASALVLADWAGWADTRPAQKYLHVGGKLAEKFADLVD